MNELSTLLDLELHNTLLKSSPTHVGGQVADRVLTPVRSVVFPIRVLAYSW